MNGRVLDKVSQKMTTQMACRTCQKYNRCSNRILRYHCIYSSAALLLIRLAWMKDDARKVTSQSFNCRVRIDNVPRDRGRDGGRKGFQATTDAEIQECGY